MRPRVAPPVRSDIGATVEMTASADTGDHLLATIGNGPTRVMLLGHFDTVWPLGQLDRMPIRESEGRPAVRTRHLRP